MDPEANGCKGVKNSEVNGCKGFKNSEANGCKGFKNPEAFALKVFCFGKSTFGSLFFKKRKTNLNFCFYRN